MPQKLPAEPAGAERLPGKGPTDAAPVLENDWKRKKALNSGVVQLFVNNKRVLRENLWSLTAQLFRGRASPQPGPAPSPGQKQAIPGKGAQETQGEVSGPESSSREGLLLFFPGGSLSDGGMGPRVSWLRALSPGPFWDRGLCCRLWGQAGFNFRDPSTGRRHSGHSESRCGVSS